MSEPHRLFIQLIEGDRERDQVAELRLSYVPRVGETIHFRRGKTEYILNVVGVDYVIDDDQGAFGEDYILLTCKWIDGA